MMHCQDTHVSVDTWLHITWKFAVQSFGTLREIQNGSCFIESTAVESVYSQWT